MKSVAFLSVGVAALSLAACASVAEMRASAASEAAAPDNPWYEAGQAALAARKAQTPNNARAKNVILFVADGMDPTTVAAARIFDGQSRGEDGEENYLSFERFPHLAMAKTYTTTNQTPDSAGTMSAMVTGVKTKSLLISVTDEAEIGDCASGLAAKATTLGELSEAAGLSTGVVSTARLTHATPAAVYAHAAHRRWEADTDLSESAESEGCTDIASQLIDYPYGNGLEVALGGGRGNFLPADATDPEYPDRTGRREDGRNLVEEWTAKSDNHVYVWNKSEFDALDASRNPRILGLFESSHMQYEEDRADDAAGEPSLAEMTAMAIDVLAQNENGFFLVVEAGRVDHAHHRGNALRALKDAQAFSEAIARARSMTSEDDTLIIATADHGHTLAFQGYPKKGNNILGLVTEMFPDEANPSGFSLAADGKPYTTLVYGNGPGSLFHEDGVDGRPAPDPQGALARDYRQQALIPTNSETHGGQDVPVYASGPKAHLISGVFEQNYIFHVMADALGL